MKFMELSAEEKVESINALAETSGTNIILAAGFDGAIIGVTDAGGEVRVVYSVEECLSLLEGDGMTHEDAVEHFDFSVRQAYVGEGTPIWVEAP